MNIVKQAKATHIFASLALLVLGIILIAVPERFAQIRYLAGAFLIFAGASRVFGYFSNDLYKLAFQFDLAQGILTAVLGGYILVSGANIGLLLVIISLYVTVDSLLKIQTSIDAKRFGMRSWGVIFAGAAALSAFGIFALLDPVPFKNSKVILMGVCLVLQGAGSVIVTAAMVRVKAKKKNVFAKYEHFFKKRKKDGQ